MVRSNSTANVLFSIVVLGACFCDRASAQPAPQISRSARESFTIRRNLEPVTRATGGFWNGVTALQFESVRADLGLAEQQQESIKVLNEQIVKDAKQLRADLLPAGQTAPREVRDSDRARIDAFVAGKSDAIKQVLTPGQQDRLQQIVCQLKGVEMFDDPIVVQALNLTETQQTQIRREISAFKNRYRASRTRGGVVTAAQSPEEAGKRRAELKKMEADCDATIAGILTMEQQETLKVMKGKPFNTDPVLGRE